MDNIVGNSYTFHYLYPRLPGTHITLFDYGISLLLKKPYMYIYVADSEGEGKEQKTTPGYS